MRRTRRREHLTNITAIVLALGTAFAAAVGKPLYGVLLWSFGWAAAVIVALACIVASAGLRSACQRCDERHLAA